MPAPSSMIVRSYDLDHLQRDDVHDRRPLTMSAGLLCLWRRSFEMADERTLLWSGRNSRYYVLCCLYEAWSIRTTMRAFVRQACYRLATGDRTVEMTELTQTPSSHRYSWYLMVSSMTVRLVCSCFDEASSGVGTGTIFTDCL